ncbi:hypothetical protein WJX72_005269 [[Myrmecia] bisecta]|uniref:Uncharacterized protein n=1 Tax=[Myrmecia] bisecta TaxID=41462 RepID=A0AAW1QF61_9CHLO
MGSFKALPEVELSEPDMHVPLPLGPDSLKHGRLANGMSYYVRPCSRPKQRAAVALAVRVGSVVEEDHEQGIAHIVEHLAFNATEKYSNHDLVKFLESIGAEFGACQNAYTSADETVYELLVPVDDLSTLQETFSVLAQFATKIRCAPEDLQKERGAVLEEWRMGKDQRGRSQQSHWKLLLEGNKYADRLPIGQEQTIKTVPAAVVRGFYERWYRPENMAVIAVGDFADPDAVVDMLRQQLEPAQSRSLEPAQPIPSYPLVPHTQPRFQAEIDKETQQAVVHVCYLHPNPRCTTPAEFVEYLKEGMFQLAINNRFFKMARKPDPPFYGAQIAPEQLCSTISSYVVTASVQEGGALQAFEALMIELARVRLHGFSPREVQVACLTTLSDVESSYLERDQSYSQDLRDEYIRHFLHEEFVIGREFEARLSKTFLPKITAQELAALAEMLRSTCSCVVKVGSHKRSVSVDELKAVMAKVDAMEARGEIGPWQEDDVPTSILEHIPEPGQVVEERVWPEIGSKEILLANGMKVCYKVTDYLEDQVMLSGFAAGGLSEVDRAVFRSCSLATTLAQEMGLFGVKPELLMDILMGKRAEIKVQEGAYWRNFGGEQSPADLETAMQMIYKLFTHEVKPVPSELNTCLRYLREVVIAQIRNPLHFFNNRVRFINYDRCYYFEPFTLRDLDTIDPQVACSHFNDAFNNPAEFTLCLTGNVQEEELLRLVKVYLASIPATDHPPKRGPQQAKPLPFKFPDHVVREDVKVGMVMPRTQSLITFPVESLITFPVEVAGAGSASALEEATWLSFACQLLETKLMQVLRFRYGEVYTVQIAPFFGAEAPSRTGSVRGDVGISFSCDPATAHRLIEMALDELERLQAEGPTEDEVKTIITLEQRSFETQVHENSYWHEMMCSSYQSRTFQREQDLDAVYTKRITARKQVIAAMTPATMQAALCRLFPNPCRTLYTAITLLPQPPLHRRVRVALAALAPSTPRKAGAWLVGLAALSTAAYLGARWWQRSRSQSA